MLAVTGVLTCSCRRMVPTLAAVAFTIEERPVIGSHNVPFVGPGRDRALGVLLRPADNCYRPKNNAIPKEWTHAQTCTAKCGAGPDRTRDPGLSQRRCA